jgi:hypothetical protein
MTTTLIKVNVPPMVNGKPSCLGCVLFPRCEVQIQTEHHDRIDYAPSNECPVHHGNTMELINDYLHQKREGIVS